MLEPDLFETLVVHSCISMFTCALVLAVSLMGCGRVQFVTACCASTAHGLDLEVLLHTIAVRQGDLLDPFP
jgi:hypothetical protein